MVAILPHFTRIIAGIPVPNTPLINASISMARDNLPDDGYNHVMRAWLNGQAIINKLPAANRSGIDQEAFGVAAILHDLGWSPNPDFISSDKRFEVDGAIAARSFLQHEGGEKWDKHRQQLVWDSIALHTNADIARYKELEVALVSAGTITELVGPEIGKQFFGDLITVNQAEWEQIAIEFPRQGLKGYFRDVMTGLCRFKPDTTYQNFVGDYGEVFMKNYTRVGHRLVDLMESVLPE
ncbi:hypothetical protein K469DRAFT_570351 [Zopfia rhizophila CBS 207.26]|uniref:HD domain-containing protein n=1 Tax=Zopfia rhizophila CBS 207.26 TaxID=1314779 RepID=A0A6A6E6A4_9PEZI|nr:hypothetical protein K469DRAFT_570351 [Zopfia rhizophila CBS 207.26]